MRTFIRSLSLLAVAAALLAVTGCNTVSGYVRSKPYPGAPTFAPTAPATVQILHSQPSAPHVRLGEITIKPQSSPNAAEIEAKFQGAAARMGANAVAIVSDQTRALGTVVASPWWGGTILPQTDRVIVGVAIRYTQ